MKSFLCNTNSVDRALTQGDNTSTLTIAALRQWSQQKTFRGLVGVGMSCLFSVTLIPRQAKADPAPNAANFSRTTPGAISTTVPDGICAVAMTVTGGGGGASSAGGTGGGGGAGAIIKSQFQVMPGQTVTGTVGSGGGGNTGASANLGGSGTASGGDGGTIVSNHRGGGGGGSSSVSIAGIKLIEAGAGGGGGAAHNPAPAGIGGDAGFSGITPGGGASGSNGQAGVDSPGIPGGGGGGQVAAGGVGGSNTGDSSVNGSPGGGIGSGVGGNGGPDPNFDAAGGGGGGYTGGGGGASTLNSSVSGSGGGGGSSYVRSTSPTAAASVPTNVSGTAGTRATGNNAGADGAVTLDWIPCVYSLGITKKASATTVNVGDKVIWTVTVRNNGSDPMTRGDTITLTDTLPTTGISASTPQFKVLSLRTTNGSTDSNLDSNPITCTGVTVGQAMPASTVCSRPYSSASSPGVTTSGTRGLNSGETLTITYEEIIANKTAAATITNTASTKDRSSTSGTTDIIGVTATPSASDSVSLQPYDLKVVKSASVATAAPGTTLIWTVDVTNLGSADMEGPIDPTANPLIVNDTAPTTNVSAPTGFTSTGPAGTCTYALGRITCPRGLPAGQTQTFTFQQTVNANAPANATISNTATVSDYITGDSNDSSTSAVQTINISNADLTLSKTHNGNFTVGTPASYTLTVNNAGSATTSGTITVTDNLPTGLTIPNGAVTLSGTNAANWICNANNNVVTCTSSMSIATSGSSTFTLTGIQVGATAISSVTNTASVSGGGESNTTNNNASDPTTVNGSPNLLLVKRITAINGGYVGRDINGNAINFANVVDDLNTSDDNAPNWVSNYLKGAIDAGIAKVNDELEYTIYFLSNGTSLAKNALICDRIPTNATFLPTAFNSGNFAADPAGLPGAERGIVFSLGGSGMSLSNVGDGDRAQFFPAGVEPTTIYPKINCGGTNTNGAIVVNLGDLPNATASGVPTSSYGFVRFRATVK